MRVKLAIATVLFTVASILTPIGASADSHAAMAAKENARYGGTSLYGYHDANLRGAIDWYGEELINCRQGVNTYWTIPWPAKITLSSLSVQASPTNSTPKCNVVGVQSGSGTLPWYWKCVNYNGAYSNAIMAFGSSGPNNWYNDNIITVGLSYTPSCPLFIW